MVQEIQTKAGGTAHVLDVDDLDKAKNSLIRWLLLTVVPLVLALGVYAERLNARNEAQDDLMHRNQVRLDRVEQAIEANRVVKERLDSVLIEMRHLSEAVQTVNRNVKGLR